MSRNYLYQFRLLSNNDDYWGCNMLSGKKNSFPYWSVVVILIGIFSLVLVNSTLISSIYWIYFWPILLIILGIVVVLNFIRKIINEDHATNHEEQNEKHVLEEIDEKLYWWHNYAWWLRVFHIFIGLIAVISSITIASSLLDGTKGETLRPWIAWITAISTGILTSFNLGEKSNNMRRAWRELTAAKMIYDSKAKKDTPIYDLINSYKEGENIIGDLEIKMPKA
jgi:hypothetical protein